MSQNCPPAKRTLAVAAMAGVTMASILACKKLEPDAAKPAATKPAASSHAEDPGISLECAADHIRNAPSPFHWSYKKTTSVSGTVSSEADVTADSIDGKTVDGSGEREIHGSRANASSWNTAVLLLAGPLPAGTIALVQNTSARVRVGHEPMNGEDAIRYDIDTAHDTPPEAALIRNTMGQGGFIKGSAWVTREGCPLKLTLDAEQHLNDGTVEKEHYEAAMTKK